MTRNVLLAGIAGTAAIAFLVAQPKPQKPDTPMSIEEYEPRSTLVVPQHPVPRAKYPFIDVHNHQYELSPEKVDKLVRDMDSIHLQVMVQLSGGYGDNLRKNIEALKGAIRPGSWCSPTSTSTTSTTRIGAARQRRNSKPISKPGRRA